jgi:hypothetical protein
LSISNIFDNFNDCENNDRILSKTVKKVKILDHKTTTNPSGKWVSMVKDKTALPNSAGVMQTAQGNMWPDLGTTF